MVCAAKKQGLYIDVFRDLSTVGVRARARARACEMHFYTRCKIVLSLLNERVLNARRDTRCKINNKIILPRAVERPLLRRISDARVYRSAELYEDPFPPKCRM